MPDTLILYAEDDAAVRLGTTTMLLDAGFRVVGVGRPEQALDMLDHGDPPRFDLLLTDVLLGSTPGSELAREVTARQPHLKVLYVSGYGRDDLAERCLLDDDAFLLEKPYAREALLDAGEAALSA